MRVCRLPTPSVWWAWAWAAAMLTRIDGGVSPPIWLRCFAGTPESLLADLLTHALCPVGRLWGDFRLALCAFLWATC
ncbi:hypothetical protein IWX50DRAFT_621868, partial [Phyllosticta citricarpa]